MNSITIYIGENENIFEYLDNLNIELDRQSRSNIYSISRKSNNNYIGYYQFRAGESYYKIFVLPKLFSTENNTKEILQVQFLEFLKQYYRLKIKYGDKLSTKSINGNITDISIGENSIEECTSVEDFMHYKYMDALQTVKKFFQKHKRLKYINKAYSSQSIRHKIDLVKNIRSLDKSIVHQTKKNPVSYSTLASIALSVLKVFRRQKLASINPSLSLTEDLSSLTVSNINVLNKRFTFDKKFSISIRELTAHKTLKLFSKNTEHKRLYDALLVLSGKEHFGDGSDRAEKQNKINNMISIFFNPADLFEWIVYDQLATEYPSKVLKDGLDTESKKDYYLCNRSSDIKIIKSSEPDFIIKQDNDTDIVVDAKWKIPKSFSKIHYEDVAKLKRDCKLRGTTKAILIYPELPEGYKGAWHFDDDLFTFKLQVCSVNNEITKENF